MLGRYIDPGNPASDHPLNSGLAEWWLPLPGTFGSRLPGLLGHYPGTVAGAPAWRSGPNGFAALSFDGTTHEVNTGLAPTATFTWSVWFRWTKSVDFETMLGVHGANYLLFDAVGTPSADKIRFLGADGVDLTGTTVLAQDRWYHAAAVRAGNGVATTGMKLYLNGVLESQASTAAYTPSANPVYIGSRHDTAGQWFVGSLTDARVYTRALPADEVWRLYDQSRRGHPDTLRRWGRKAYLFGTGAAGAAGSYYRTLLRAAAS